MAACLSRARLRSGPIDRREAQPPALQFAAQPLRLLFRRFAQQAVSASRLNICRHLLADALVELENALIAEILKSHGEDPQSAWSSENPAAAKRFKKAGRLEAKAALNQKGAVDQLGGSFRENHLAKCNVPPPRCWSPAWRGRERLWSRKCGSGAWNNMNVAS